MSELETSSALERVASTVGRMRCRRARMAGLAGGQLPHELDAVQVGALAATPELWLCRRTRGLPGPEEVSHPCAHAVMARETEPRTGQDDTAHR